MSGERVIGTCGRCGGDVVEHGIQQSVRPLRPSCTSCGATKALPVIDMGTPPQRLGRGFAKRGDV